jgi:hypothetical protein
LWFFLPQSGFVQQSITEMFSPRCKLFHSSSIAQTGGLTDIDVVVVRDGKNLKGRLLDLVLGRIGEGVLEKAFKNSVKALEARNGAALTEYSIGRSMSSSSLPPIMSAQGP